MNREVMRLFEGLYVHIHSGGSGMPVLWVFLRWGVDVRFSLFFPVRFVSTQCKKVDKLIDINAVG